MPGADGIVARDGNDGVCFWEDDVANLKVTAVHQYLERSCNIDSARRKEKEETVPTSDWWPCNWAESLYSMARLEKGGLALLLSGFDLARKVLQSLL